MRAAVSAWIFLLLAVPPPVRAQDDASGLRRWVEAVRSHTPGTPDAAAGFVASMSYADRRQLYPAMEIFLRVLGQEPGRPRSAGMAQIFNLAESARQHPGVASFLRRAIVLHTDTAIYRRRFPSPPDDGPQLQFKRDGLPIPPPETPPLLSNDRLVLHTDGRVVGSTVADWNWPFARSLITRLLSSPAVPQGDRVFASQWYHAVAAFLSAVDQHGHLRPHLAEAARVLPDDPRLLFDRACFAEMLGLPIYQMLSADPTNALNRLQIGVPAQSTTDAEAETLFRDTLRIDPNFGEARVRLARLLDLRGRRDEAARELEMALAGPLDRTALFYARLFAGRIALDRGNAAGALAHFTEALKLFPGAQSALVAASHAAVLVSDVPAALSFAQRLEPQPDDAQRDPWWTYRIGAGRDADALMALVWARATL